MTTFFDLLFPRRSNPAMAQVARDWQPSQPSQPKKAVHVDLAKLPGYEQGMYARRYHQRMEDAIQAAMSPDLSNLTTLKPPPQIDQLSTLKNNPATPTPEARKELFQDVPDLAESLVLWKPDPDATDKHVVVRRADGPRNTLQIPAMPAEMLLLEVMRRDTHEQSTGENERLSSGLPNDWHYSPNLPN